MTMAKPTIPHNNKKRPTSPPQLDARQALTVGALACEYLLTGDASKHPEGCQPELATFEPADLELAAALLRHMARLAANGGRA
jgi:hypothetical protein